MARDLILSIFPELTAVGGIQQMSRHVGATLEEFAASKGLRCELIGLNDPSGEGVFEVAGREYRFRGFARNKAALLAHLTGRARQTQLVLTSHVNLGPLALWMKMLQGRARYWVMVHGMEVWKPLPLARRTALRKADGIIAVSRHTAEATAKVQGVMAGKIAMLSPALDPRHSAPDSEPPQWPVPPGSKVLLTVARLLASEPGKGVDTVIRALQRLLKSFPNLYYVVIGDGDDRPALEKLAVDCGVAGRGLLPGSRAGSLRGRYGAADVFVNPSRHEGFGIVYLDEVAFVVVAEGRARGPVGFVANDEVKAVQAVFSLGAADDID